MQTTRPQRFGQAASALVVGGQSESRCRVEQRHAELGGVAEVITDRPARRHATITHRRAHNSRGTRAGLPAANTRVGRSRVTTLPAPTTVSLLIPSATCADRPSDAAW